MKTSLLACLAALSLGADHDGLPRIELRDAREARRHVLQRQPVAVHGDVAGLVEVQDDLPRHAARHRRGLRGGQGDGDLVLGMFQAFGGIANDIAANAKPVVLAAGVSQAIITTVFGLVPIILAGSKPGGELLAPLAVVQFGGLLGATVLNLVVLPAAVKVFGLGARSGKGNV